MIVSDASFATDVGAPRPSRQAHRKVQPARPERRSSGHTGPTGDYWRHGHSFRWGPDHHKGITASVEVQLRDARLTDIDRVISLVERADPRWTLEQLASAADVLRQMVYLPNASLLVALDGRMLVGVAVLALRPSVSAGGLVGTVDLLCVEPGHEDEGVTDSLLHELIRSARNKGCVVLEGEIPAESAEFPRWEAAGFTEAGTRLRCPLVRTAALPS